MSEWPKSQTGLDPGGSHPRAWAFPNGESPLPLVRGELRSSDGALGPWGPWARPGEAPRPEGPVPPGLGTAGG